VPAASAWSSLATTASEKPSAGIAFFGIERSRDSSNCGPEHKSGPTSLRKKTVATAVRDWVAGLEVSTGRSEANEAMVNEITLRTITITITIMRRRRQTRCW